MWCEAVSCVYGDTLTVPNQAGGDYWLVVDGQDEKAWGLRSHGQPQPSLVATARYGLRLSGCVSLVYEVVWARLLATHLGSTTKGHTVVIATFMAGLGLGYLLFGRRSDRSESPLRLYGQLELGVALSAFLIPYALSLTELWPWLSVFWVLVPTVLRRTFRHLGAL